MVRYHKAAWRPLPEHGAEARNFPRLFIAHIIVGSLAGAEAWFRREDVKSESHFGLGEGHEEDPIRQWLDTDEEADTNWDANGISITVETAGQPDEPFTDFQIAELIDMGVWAAKTHNLPAQIADGPRGKGFGWHSQYPEWNRSNHTCPGPVRIQQLKDVVYPAIFRELEKPVGKKYAQAVVVHSDVDLEHGRVLAQTYALALCRIGDDGKLWSETHPGTQATVDYAFLVGQAATRCGHLTFVNGSKALSGPDRDATARKVGEWIEQHRRADMDRRGVPWR